MVDFKTNAFPPELLTGTTNPRLRTDNGEAGFWEGRSFYSFHEVSIPNNGTVTIKLSSLVDYIIEGFSVSLADGHVLAEVIVGATETSSFDTPITVLDRNNMTGTPTYSSQMSISTGGSVTGGLRVEVLELSGVGQGQNTSTVGAATNDEIGVAAGAAYYVFENLDNSASKIIIHYRWEERP